MNRPQTPSRRSVPVAVAVIFGLLVSGCSSVPDWANPVEWYHSATGVFDSDSEARDQARAAAKAGPGTNASYPNLSTVPDRPRDIASTAQRGKVQQGLVADRNQARYAALGTANQSGTPAAAAPSQWAPTASPQPPSPAAVARPVAAQDQVSTAYQQALRQSAGGAPVPPPVAAPAPEALAPGPVRRNVTPLPPERRSRLVLKAPPGAAQPEAAMAGPGMSVLAGTIYFGNGSSALSGKDDSLLKSIANAYKEKGGSLRVVGHASSRTRNTDPVRHNVTNFRISMARANAVARRLIRLGVPAGKVAVMAKADNEPVYYEFMPSGEAGNRRAEIFLDY